eukprot:TRINITY_DN10942_c0_g1_i1.p1 TRINITY_DN10942_c0_g1~~TRINITY_DN10942_c0_g1_i1.p1  ORF type:complete len:222 (-),score=51.31 TRINITY_DN10942_c0_g1_i1:121-786(-)
MVKIAIVGGGLVGSKIGAQLLKSGQEVKYAQRDPTSEKVKALLEQPEQSKATTATIHEALEWCEVAFLTVPGQHKFGDNKAVADSLGPGAKGKVIIDATNPLSPYPGLETRWDGSLSAGEEFQQHLPDSFVYKALNTVPAEHFAHPDGSLINGKTLVALVAGHPEKKDLALKVIEAIGLETAYVGPIRYARNLESLAELYIHMSAFQQWGRNWTFQIDKKK